MKSTILIALACLSTAAFAQRFPGPHPAPTPLPGRGDEVRECRISLEREQMESRRLLVENSDLRNQSNQLNDENVRLRIENRRLEDELRNRRDDRRDDRRNERSFFSYAGCKSYGGAVDTNYLAGAEGLVPLMAETNAKQEVAKKFTCSWGIDTVKTEEITTNEQRSYCVAGCAAYGGNVDQAYIRSATGRNRAEAEYKAMIAVKGAFTCSWGIKIQACQ